MDKVLIIDDDKFMQKMLKTSLADFYDTREALNGEEGLLAANDWHPDVILLDVEMPGRNGYEICDQLKRSPATKDIPVLFLSSRSSVRERMLGYEVGADDYLTKPCSQEELGAKLSRLTQHIHVRQELKKSADSAHQTALEAMSTSYELGKAIRFVERSFFIPNFDVLGEQLMEFMGDLDLSAVAMISSSKGYFFYSSSMGDVAPLEAQLMEMLHDNNKRFIDFGSRTQVNYPNMALLVKNMPLEDRARYGRLKDTLPFVLGASDAKVRMIDAEFALIRQSAELTASVESVQSTLKSMNGIFNNNLTAVSTIMSELLHTLSIDLVNMGLDHDQEEYVGEKVEGASKKISTCLNENARLEESLAKVVQMLERLTQEQQRIIVENLSSKPVFENDNASDIELF